MIENSEEAIFYIFPQYKDKFIIMTSFPRWCILLRWDSFIEKINGSVHSSQSEFSEVVLRSGTGIQYQS